MRESYGKQFPRLLSELALAELRSVLQRWLEKGIQGIPRLSASAGNIAEEMNVRIDKLARTVNFSERAPVLDSSSTRSKVFVTYSHDSPEHKQWVKEFAGNLRSQHGIDIILDVWDLQPGQRGPHFMERSVKESKFVLVVCTEGYKLRFDAREGGVGYEGQIITGELIKEVGSEKFIPILRGADWNSSVPTALSGISGVDLSKDDSGELDKLVKRLRKEVIKPPLGGPKSRSEVSSQEDAPLLEHQRSTEEAHSPADELRLHREKRDGQLVIWLHNEALDPMERCSVTLVNLQEYSERKGEFHRNPFPPIELIKPHTIHAGRGSSGGAALARCPEVFKKRLKISNSRVEFDAGAIWLADLLITGGGGERSERLFLKWSPGGDPEFTSDPRL